MRTMPVAERWKIPAAIMLLVLFAGCAIHKDVTADNTAVPAVYDTTDKIFGMPSCKAAVVERGPCYVQLRTTSGKGFLIGSPAAGPEILEFIGLLKDGRTYRFPSEFQKYQEQRSRAGKDGRLR